ncbi:uncharacterized protein EKO05_0003901 [Ascochyta rabiei]|uniref:uncharacterized protein n=1 Tax=Didymella rabiei TaxID=5454 RepID=UPI00220C0B60|nr:uncharacterized protein EKO05_0003901 [Ascochyta rabiei]UPX13392.1 hypothetical protein EKO05_0003901 [Ascochyta rabiei]
MDTSAQQQDVLSVADDILSAPMSAQDGQQHDWTEDLAQTAHIRLFRDTDWTRNGLAPLKDWDSTLRLYANFVFADSRAACLCMFQ